MNRWKNFIVLLLTVAIIITNSITSYAGMEKQGNRENSIAVSGEGSGNASSDASGDISGNASGEGKKEYVTISFYDGSRKPLKVIQIEKGGTVELWNLNEPHYAKFAGWYIVDGDNKYHVTETTTFNEDTSLFAGWYITGCKGCILHSESDESYRIKKQMDFVRKLTCRANIEIKNITIKKKGKVSLKIRSTYMPQSPIELQYSTSKKFAKGKTKTKVINRTKNKSVKTFNKITIKKLKKNKTYYIRARVKSKYNGETFYSKWSKVQKVNMKKEKQTENK